MRLFGSTTVLKGDAERRARPVAVAVVALGAAVVFGGLTPSASADTVLYTFEGPQFTVGETTPLLNRSPNVGSAAFQTTFTASPAAATFEITTFIPNVLFNGQSLFDGLGAPTDPLTLTFNTPVDQIQFDFATNGPGTLELLSPVGSTSQVSVVVGGTFPGGTLVFSSPTPFTTVQLQARTPGGAPLEFAVDDLQLQFAGAAAVPEPATALLAGVGLAGLLTGLRRRGSARQC
jgi:hypothetical protein